MARATRITRTGGPEVLELVDVDVPPPGPGEVTVRHEAIGLNFIDVYRRSGLYQVPLPSGLGTEAAGVVEAAGEGAAFAPGDRVAYATGPIGAYTDRRTMPSDVLVRIPDGIDATTAAAALLKGMTAEMLARRVFRAEAGQTALVHAAAGGVGSILTQWLAAIGVTVIGTVGSPAKAEIARRHCNHVIVSGDEDVAARVRELTGGEGCHVVYDGVGKDTFAASLDSVRKRGLLVSFGNASGKPPPLDLLVLSQKGSLFVTRPTLFTWVDAREELVGSATALWDRILAGDVRVDAPRVVPLAEAARAHRDLEARATTGSTVLVP